MRFSRSPQRYGATPPAETAYQRAGQLWDERIGASRAQAYSWRLAFFASLAILSGSVAGNVWQSAQSRVEPYVVEVDRLGEAKAVGPAEQDWQPDDGVLAAALERFVVDVRALSSDPVVVRQRWLDAYRMVTDKGRVFLDPYARAGGLAASAGERTVSAQPISTVRVSDRSFRVDWIEQTFERGALSSTHRWTSTITLVRIKPKTKADVKHNPLGLYVDAVDWSEQSEAPLAAPPSSPPIPAQSGVVQP